MARATSSLSDFFFVHFSWFGMFPFWTVSTEEIRARSSDHLWVIVYYIISFVLFFFTCFSLHPERSYISRVCIYRYCLCQQQREYVLWGLGRGRADVHSWGVGRRGGKKEDILLSRCVRNQGDNIRRWVKQSCFPFTGAKTKQKTG